MKKVFAMLLVLVLALGMFSATAEGIKVGVSFGQNVHPFFVAMQLGIEAACKDFGVEDCTILAAD